MSDQPVISPDLLELLRCPVAVQNGEGEDPGRLELVKETWLVCRENGYKYPIVDGIPVMLPEIGEKYQSVEEDSLPVPPPRPE